jgi:acyl-CoA synthetase (AMP-forming)/AMP-acid ligase II
MRTTPNERINDLTQRGWWGDRTLDTLFQAAVRSSPDHVALVDQFNRSDFTDGEAQRFTYAELATIADNLAAAFYANGLRQDDIVVVQLPNIVELAVLYLALGKLGVILSPVPVQYGPFELKKAKQVVSPKAFISTTNFKGKNFAREHGDVFREDSKIFCFGDDTPEGAVALMLSADASSADAAYRAYIDSLDITANDIFTICWTSGTTGQPKGVPRSHNMWMASATGSHDAALLRDNEILLNPFPLVNMAAIGGFLYCWLMRRLHSCAASSIRHAGIPEANPGREDRLHDSATRRPDDAAEEARDSRIGRYFEPALHWLGQRAVVGVHGGRIRQGLWHRDPEHLRFQRGYLPRLGAERITGLC